MPITKSHFVEPELQIRRGTEDTSKIFFLFLKETYDVTPN